MSAPLTNHQKAYLAQLAARAHRAWIAQDPPTRSAITAEEFRHHQVASATGKLGLRCCSQDDYKTAEAHFLNLLGHTGEALNAHLRAATETRRVARYKLDQACAEFGLSINYANAICRRQHRGLTIDDITERQIWQLVYTIRNRGRANKRHHPYAQT
jgi:hypothetical protein